MRSFQGGEVVGREYCSLQDRKEDLDVAHQLLHEPEIGCAFDMDGRVGIDRGSKGQAPEGA